MDAQKEIDTRGLNCPLPILKAKKALADMKSGDVLKVVATDPGSVRDFQAGAMPMIAQEKKGFIEAAKEKGITDEKVLDRFGDAYAIPAGVVEYGMGSLVTAPIRATPKIGKGKGKTSVLHKIPGVSLAIKNNTLKQAISNVVGPVGIAALEGTEALTQAELQDAVMYWALTDAAKDSPENSEYYIKKRDEINLKPFTKEKFDNFVLGFAASLPQTIASRILDGAGSRLQIKSLEQKQKPMKMPEAKVTPEVESQVQETKKPVVEEKTGKTLADFKIPAPEAYFKLPETQRNQIFQQLSDAEQTRVMEAYPEKLVEEAKYAERTGTEAEKAGREAQGLEQGAEERLRVRDLKGDRLEAGARE